MPSLQALLAMSLFLILMAVFFVAKDTIDTEEKLNFVLWVLITVGGADCALRGISIYHWGGNGCRMGG